MRKLGVNIDHIATIRELRKTSYPDLVEAAKIVKAAGAHQLTIHLREDRRHIQDRDVLMLKEWNQLPLNLEMAAASEIVAIACQVKPAIATLVPERREELTTEGGLDVCQHFASLRPIIHQLQQNNIEVSLFIDPEEKQVRAARESGVSAIELHTGTYCEQKNSQALTAELRRLQESCALARSLDLRVACGHGLNHENITRVVREISDIEEYNIGHAIVARAVFVGLKNAIEEIRSIMEECL